MNPNDNKNNKNSKNNNWRGIISLICWALVLTIVVSYFTNVMGSTGRQASSVNLEYSQFVEMVESGQVTLRGGACLPVSRSCQAAALLALTRAELEG